MSIYKRIDQKHYVRNMERELCINVIVKNSSRVLMACESVQMSIDF